MPHAATRPAKGSDSAPPIVRQTFHVDQLPVGMKVEWRPNPGPQTMALQVRNIRELLFGGARGGGKTMAGIVWLILPPAAGFHSWWSSSYFDVSRSFLLPLSRLRLLRSLPAPARRFVIFPNLGRPQGGGVLA